MSDRSEHVSSLEHGWGGSSKDNAGDMAYLLTIGTKSDIMITYLRPCRGLPFLPQIPDCSQLPAEVEIIGRD